MLNDVYSEEELPDFRLGTRPRAPRRAAATPAATAATPPTAAASSQDDEATDPDMPPAASAIPEDRFQQLLDRVDVLSHQQQQLQSDFATFRQQISDQQMELLAGQRRILGYFGYDPGNSSFQPPS